MTREEAKVVCAKRILSGQQFTFTQLLQHLIRNLGSQGAEGFDPYRLADTQIQSFRKRNLISFTRDGRTSIWTLTDAGRAHAKEQANG